MTRRQVISQMYVEASDILVSLDTAAAQAFLNRSMAMNRECEQKIHEYMRSEEPGHWAVRRAVLHRYWKRIVANLAGIVSSAIEPIQTLDYADGGSTDIVDD